MGPEVVKLILMFLGVLALWTMLHRWAWTIRSGRRPPGEYQPIVERDPPAAVMQCTSVVVVGYAGLLWSAAHLVVAALWCVTGLGTDRSATGGMVMAYSVAAAIITSIGSAMLLARKPFGRRVISFGQFLFVLGGTMGAAVCLLLPFAGSLPKQTRDMAPILAVAMLSHLAVATLIGYAAQRVGTRPSPAEGPPEA